MEISGAGHLVEMDRRTVYMGSGNLITGIVMYGLSPETMLSCPMLCLLATDDMVAIAWFILSFISIRENMLSYSSLSESPEHQLFHVVKANVQTNFYLLLFLAHSIEKPLPIPKKSICYFWFLIFGEIFVSENCDPIVNLPNFPIAQNQNQEEVETAEDQLDSTQQILFHTFSRLYKSFTRAPKYFW